MKFNTKVIHAGVHPDPSTGAIMTPIYQTSTYVQEAPGVHKGYEYARTQNPTRSVLEENIAALENGTHGLVYGSGLAALDVILKTLNPGDHVIATDDLYGGSYRLMVRQYQKYGIQFDFINMADLEQIQGHLKENTALVWVETPTNPMLKIIDIKSICALVADHKAIICVDNTFASPYLQRPLDLGADVVLHSATKYLGGHSDVVLGILVTNNDKLAEQYRFLQNAAGAVTGPQDCFLVLRGIKTLHLRVQRSCENAKAIALFLLEQNAVDNVYYPGFPDHPGHDIAREQMDDFGGMVSFDFKDDRLEVATKVLSNTEYFMLAESLGGVESLIGHPASMTHASIPREERLRVGLTDSLIRLSVGVEDIEDLKNDLAQAFAKL